MNRLLSQNLVRYWTSRKVKQGHQEFSLKFKLGI